MRFEISCAFARGLKKKNEDSLYYARGECRGRNAAMAAVFDGVGGLPYGERASGCAARMSDEWFRRHFQELMFAPRRRVCEGLDAMLREAGREIGRIGTGEDGRYGSGTDAGTGGGSGSGADAGAGSRAGFGADAGAGARSGLGAGTTASVIVFSGRAFVRASVGDSRIYRIRGGRTDLLTTDQALPGSNIITACLGQEVHPDTQIRSGNARRGDIFLLCTDGFRRLIDMEAVGRELMRAGSAAGASAVLKAVTEELLMRGESDNMTAVAVRCI